MSLTNAQNGTPSPAMDDSQLPLDRLASNLRDSGQIQRLLQLAYDEDLVATPSGDAHDWTGELMFTPDQAASARLVLRETGVVSGLEFVPDILGVFVGGDESMDWSAAMSDGEHAQAGAVLGTLTGSAIALVRLERTLLNLTSRMSGIATRTHRFVQLVQGTNAKICDTRKTTPGLRALEKYAVRCGGGVSHRMGLYDALLIKDNHLAGLKEDAFKERVVSASARARQQNLSFVQVEVDTLVQLRWVLELSRGTVDFVLLDNMPPNMLTEAVGMRDASNPDLKLEASGGVTEATLPGIARSGVDRISIGGLTHQAVSLDIGLDAL